MAKEMMSWRVVSEWWTGLLLHADLADSSPSSLRLWIEAKVCAVEQALLEVVVARTPWSCAGAARLDGCLR